MRVPILYQDEDIVVIDKPAGMPTHAADAGDPYPADALRTVQAQLGASYLGMHQRLDTETSGVLLFTLRREVNSAVAAAFAGRDVGKTYLALVRGRPPRATGVIEAPIVREHGERYRIASPADPRSRPAATRYRLIATDPAGYFSLLEVVPETGRTHQIRLHLAHLGVPVVGDALYGRAPGAGRTPAEPRLGLHAYRLTLPHPRTGGTVTFSAPPPALFERLSSGLPELRLATAGRSVLQLKGSEEGFLDLLRLAGERRAPLDADPATTIYRLVNSAADGLPGLAADRYGDALVLSVYDASHDRLEGKTEVSLPLDPGHTPSRLAETMLGALAVASGAKAIYVKYRPRQASRISDRELAQLAPPDPVAGQPLGDYLAYEDGLAYLVRPGEGWNPGLFPDMREMRGRVRAWAAGRTVLNCFAYTCGFGLASIAGGAGRVLNLDLSKAVLERGQDNYRANGFEPDPHDFVYGDAFDWLGRLARRRERFDIVILDPPGYAKTKTHRFSAEQHYGDLAGLAAQVTAPDGLVVACCNVAELSWRTFRDMVSEGLGSAGRSAEVAGVYHAPQLDFPTLPGRESHLKILVARLT